jgi:hypothetical protein
MVPHWVRFWSQTPCKLDARVKVLGSRQIFLDVCAQHICESANAVISEPYIPHFPDGGNEWNGILVVAEAQNLSDRFSHYRSKLEALSRSGDREELWDRLNRSLFCDGPAIGIGPWDDGTIKLSVACLRGVDSVDQVAVSNAVVWSAREGGASEHLRREMTEASTQFWIDILRVLRPREILAFGSTARRVMHHTGFPADNIVDLPGPFSRTLQISFKMNLQRLLDAFPEVGDILVPARQAFRIENEALAIHCACASISRMLDQKERRSRVSVTTGLNIDENPVYADWTKQTWDLPATNRAELMEMLAKMNTSLQEFKRLPVFLMNVDKIEWLKNI